MNKAGFGGLNDNFNASDNDQSVSEQLSTLKAQFITARVTDVIISNTHPLFSDNGGWNGLGTIFFEPLDNLTSIKSTATNPKATPLLPYLKNYPIQPHCTSVAETSQ